MRVIFDHVLWLYIFGVSDHEINPIALRIRYHVVRVYYVEDSFHVLPWMPHVEHNCSYQSKLEGYSLVVLRLLVIYGYANS